MVNVIQPMLGAVVPQVVKTTGTENHAELVQDGMCMAAQAIEMLEKRGRAARTPVSLVNPLHRPSNSQPRFAPGSHATFAS